MSVILTGTINLTGSLNVTAGITGSLLGTATTASYVANAVSASYAVNTPTSSYALTSTSASYALNTTTASYANNSGLLGGVALSTLATTGSNYFSGTQTITGSVYIGGNLIVQGSSSLQNITASAVSIGTNTVILNTNLPSVRFAGISVYDSGSSATTGSLWWDSLNNVWVYQNPSGSSYASARLISGPQNTGSLGSETGLTVNKIPKAVGDDHIGDSNITDSGTLITINSNTQITGSLSVSSNIIGSFSGTATTASYISSLNKVGDVNKYTASAIIDGYQLAWSSGSQQWAPAAGAAAKGVTRLFVSANRNNAGAFYFTSITVTADSKASPDANTAFMVTSTLLSKVTVYLREDASGTNSVRVDITKNPDGVPFSNATGSIANSTITLSQNIVGTYAFTGLTLNQFDSIHVKVTPTSSPGQMYGIVIVE